MDFIASDLEPEASTVSDLRQLVGVAPRTPKSQKINKNCSKVKQQQHTVSLAPARAKPNRGGKRRGALLQKIAKHEVDEQAKKRNRRNRDLFPTARAQSASELQFKALSLQPSWTVHERAGTVRWAATFFERRFSKTWMQENAGRRRL